MFRSNPCSHARPHLGGTRSSSCLCTVHSVPPQNILGCSPYRFLLVEHSNLRLPRFQNLGHTGRNSCLDTAHSVQPHSILGSSPCRSFPLRLAQHNSRESGYTFDRIHSRFLPQHHHGTSEDNQSSTLDCRCIAGTQLSTGSLQPHQRGTSTDREHSTCRRPCKSRTVEDIPPELLPPCTRPRTSPRSTTSSPPASSPSSGSSRTGRRPPWARRSNSPPRPAWAPAWSHACTFSVGRGSTSPQVCHRSQSGSSRSTAPRPRQSHSQQGHRAPRGPWCTW